MQNQQGLRQVCAPSVTTPRLSHKPHDVVDREDKCIQKMTQTTDRAAKLLHDGNPGTSYELAC